ncbi:hypothetical protein [Kitasatospora indigofera]|uniref:hypothetical protein n=1 Tax=Kitasatospora indigofera TaxID=67307 RepID=UPI0033AC28E6
MPTQVNALPPSLTNELAALNRRLTAIERAPAPINTFDRYPTAEWEPIERGVVPGNIWHAMSIADVTGLVFDRIETKFTTYAVLKGQREPEIRLAAYRHSREGGKTIVSASSTWQLVGDPNTAYLAPGSIRWVHGIPYGWNYATDTDVYTVEFQVRYAVGPAQIPHTRLYVIAGLDTDSYDLLANAPVEQDTDGKWWYMPEVKEGSPYDARLIDLPGDSGNCKISAMQYCVGLPQSRVPDATPQGTLTYALEWKTVRAPDLSEAVMNL